MARRKLIFFATSDPRTEPGAFFRAYHFATVAAGAGLAAEVRLAGHAVDVADVDVLPDDEAGRTARDYVLSGADGPFLVSL